MAIEGVLEDQGDIRAWNQLVGVNLAYSQPDRRRATEEKASGKHKESVRRRRKYDGSEGDAADK